MLAVVARDRAVRGLSFNRLAVGRHQHARHQPQRTEALSDGVGLNVAVVVLAGPNVTALPLQRRSDHVVDQAVLVGDRCGFKVSLELGLVDLLEELFKTAVVELQNRVLR